MSLRQKYRLRSRSTGREVIVEAEPGRDYVDRVSGEPLDIVARVVPLAPSDSDLPWAVENLRFCPNCDQLAQRDLVRCPWCRHELPPVVGPQPS